MEEGKRLDDREHLGQKKESQEPSKYRHHFQVKYIPKGLFQLFNKSETYIYEKKFSCELPKNITTPKSFHYPYSLENYCKADLLTMDFDLKKNPDILTDPKINTFIHQDFINNSLELIYPNLTTTNTYKKRTDEEQNFKKKIIEIIERSEEVNQDNNQILNEIPDFLRRQTYLRPTTIINIEKKSKAKEKTKPEKKQKTTLQDLVKSIEQSFSDIDKIKVDMKHPDPKKKGITAKNIYELSPMSDMPNIKFIEYLFPSEPSEVPNLNENFLIPDHFIITNNKSEDPNEENTNSLYINNKLKEQEDHIEKDCAQYFTYEKEFTSTKITQNDLFNRYFFVLDKKNKKLKISPLSDKFSFRRYKKFTEGNLNLNNNIQNDEEGKEKANNKYLNKKRKKDIILVPDNMEKEELDGKKRWFKDRGYMAEFSERKIYEVDHTDVMCVEKERQKEEELKRKKSLDEEEDELFLDDEGEGEENEDNAFDEFDKDDKDKEDDEQKSNKDENDEEQNSNEEKNSNDENEEDNKSSKGYNNDNEDKNEQSEKDDENNEHEDDKYFE